MYIIDGSGFEFWRLIRQQSPKCMTTCVSLLPCSHDQIQDCDGFATFTTVAGSPVKGPCVIGTIAPYSSESRFQFYQ